MEYVSQCISNWECIWWEHISNEKLIVLFLACTKRKAVNGDHYECTKKAIIMNGRNRRDRITREQREVLSSGHSMVPNQGVNGALVNIGWSSDPWPWPGPTLASLALQPSHYMTALREMTGSLYFCWFSCHCGMMRVSFWPLFVFEIKEWHVLSK